METQCIPAGGGELQAYAWGMSSTPDASAAPVVLVHGLASNALLWVGVGEALGRLGHPTVAVDLRGHGRSWKPDDGYDFSTVAADLDEVIASVGFTRPVVVGQSWGANVVLELAARRATPLRGIGLVDGGWIHLNRRFPEWDACRDSLSPPGLTGTPLEVMEGWIRDRHVGWPESAVTGSLGCFEQRPDGTVAPWLTRERHLMILRHLWEHQPSQRYPDVEVPVLLVPADDGTAWSNDKQAAVAEAEQLLPTSRTNWFAAHHDVHAQYPDELAALLHACCDDGFFA